MSFREKSVWISFLIMLTLSGVWAWNLVRGVTGLAGRPDVIHSSTKIGTERRGFVVQTNLQLVFRYLGRSLHSLCPYTTQAVSWGGRFPHAG